MKDNYCIVIQNIKYSVCITILTLKKSVNGLKAYKQNYIIMYLVNNIQIFILLFEVKYDDCHLISMMPH